jgi:prevent-host-death family protein
MESGPTARFRVRYLDDSRRQMAGSAARGRDCESLDSLVGVNAMHEWQLQDAKNRFSEIVRRARDEGPQAVTVLAKPAAVVLSADA